MATSLGEDNPLRYRGYVYDTETSLYYLQSRYYNPHLGRFINADALASTGQGLLGNNMFAYCLNSPIVLADPDGLCAHTAYAPWLGDCSDCILYDVPLYEQDSLNLCWAYSQVMCEQFSRTSRYSQNEATVRAVSLAMQGMDENGVWNKGNFPTNCVMSKFSNQPQAFTITNEFMLIDLAILLENHGPIYGYYSRDDGTGAHMIVITGVNLRDGIVHTNNPWGERGAQDYDAFLHGVAGHGGEDYSLTYLYFPRN